MKRSDFIKNDPQILIKPRKISNNAVLFVVCHQCTQKIKIGLQSYWIRRKKDLKNPWSCGNCTLTDLYNDKSYCEKFKKLHDNPDYYKKVHNDINNNKISESAISNWQNDSNRQRFLKWRRSDEGRQRLKETASANWQNKDYIDSYTKTRSTVEYHKKASDNSKKLWNNPNYRKKMEKVLHEARPFSNVSNKYSNIELSLYSILDDMGIKHYRHGDDTIVGKIITSTNTFRGYEFDCLIPRFGQMEKNLLIDCHGVYWHGPNQEAQDRSKATFITNYFSDEYDLLILWGWEFKSPDGIIRTISEKIGLKAPIKPIQYDISDLIITKSEISDNIKLLFAKYHYLANIGRFGSIRYAAYLNDELVCCAVFNHPTRKQSAQRLGHRTKEVLELTRFCIHPKYQKKNLASWFLSKAIRKLWKDKPKVQILLTFADTTHGHDGTIYKASNWKLDGIVKPSYWYIDTNSNWYHKKTIWDHASKMSMSEDDYTSKYGLTKINGKEKLRFVYPRPNFS